MKRWTPLCVTLAVLAGVALAAQNININDIYVFQQVFRPHVRTNASLPSAAAYTGYMAFNSTNGDLTVSDGTTWRTASPIVGSVAWDFPVLGNNALDTPCDETGAITATGAAFGDGCSPSSNLGMDGGASLLPTATLSCRAATNVAYVKLCVQFTDGGTYDLGDAGFTVRISH